MRLLQRLLQSPWRPSRTTLRRRRLGGLRRRLSRRGSGRRLRRLSLRRGLTLEFPRAHRRVEATSLKRVLYLFQLLFCLDLGRLVNVDHLRHFVPGILEPLVHVIVLQMACLAEVFIVTFLRLASSH